MKKLLIAGGAVAAGACLVKQRVMRGDGFDFERWIERMPENAPPKWMFRATSPRSATTPNTSSSCSRNSAGPRQPSRHRVPDQWLWRSAMADQVAGGEGGWRGQVLEVKHRPEDVPAIYTRLAPLYELWARMTESRARRRVMELASVRPGEELLEVAVGTGVQLVGLARANPCGQTVGLEPSAGMLRQARRRIDAAGVSDRVELVDGSALELPFADASFDLLVNGYMLDLLPGRESPGAGRVQARTAAGRPARPSRT